MMSPVSGTVFLDHNFAFPDSGEIASKYIVVLCDSILAPDKVIAVRTTSKKKDKSDEFGCHQSPKRLPPPCFFVGSIAGCFPKETWLMLDYVTEYDINGFHRLTSIATLPDTLTADILFCVQNNASRKLTNLVVKSAEAQIELFRRAKIIV